MDSFLDRLDDALRRYGFVRKDYKFEVNGTDKDTHIPTCFFWEVDFEGGCPIVRPMKYMGENFIHPTEIGASIGLSQSKHVVEGLVSEYNKQKAMGEVSSESKQPAKREPNTVLVGEKEQETVFVEKEVIDTKTSSTLENLKKELLKRKDLLDKKLLDEEKNLCLCIERKKEHENRIEAIKDRILDLNSFLILAEAK
jgi:hypothetical protein